MNPKLEAAQYTFVESIGKLAESFGVNRFMAQLYAVLYLSNKPLSLDDLMEKLKASKGNISINIRELENWGAVKSVWIKGSRKDYYEADTNLKKVFTNKLRSALQKRMVEVSGMIKEFKEIVDSANGELNEEEKQVAHGYRERLKKIEELNDLASKAMMLAEKLF